MVGLIEAPVIVDHMFLLWMAGCQISTAILFYALGRHFGKRDERERNSRGEYNGD